jgi:predicted dehydrogenase
MSESLNVGIVGYGFATKTFHAPLVAGVPGLKLVAISSSDPAKVKADWPQVATETSPEALFARPDIDLVVIPTPNETHYPLASAALAAGKHVVVDKPFTVTVDDARRLQAQAEAVGRVLSVFHNRRWDSDFLTLKQVLASGELGRIVHFESHFDRYRPEVRNRWREQALAGQRAVVRPRLAPPRPDAATLRPARIDRARPRAATRQRAVGRLLPRRAALRPEPRDPARRRAGRGAGRALTPCTAVSAASSSTASIRRRTCSRPASARPRPDWGHDSVPATLTVWKDGAAAERELACIPGDYPAYYAGVRDAIRGVGPNPVTAAEVIRVIGLLELGLQSAREGRTLPVSQEALQ